VTDRRRSGRTGGVRLPPVYGPAPRDGRAVGALRAAPAAGVRAARALAPGRGRRPAPEHLDLRGVPEVAAAQRRWAGVARRAARAGAEPERVFALAHAVVARWERALHWESKTIWPRRLHQVAGGNAVGDLARWRIVGRDAVVFPEVVALTDTLLDPAMAELAWRASRGMRPRARGEDDPFCRQLGERVDRDWLGPLTATDYGGPLSAWRGAIVRARRGSGPPGWREDPWHLKREQQPPTMAGQLRVMAAEAQAGDSGTRWRATVSAEHRFHITRLLDKAHEQLVELRGAQSGTTAEVARTLLEHLRQSAELIDRAVLHTAACDLGGDRRGVGPAEVRAQVAGDVPVAGRHDGAGDGCGPRLHPLDELCFMLGRWPMSRG
jgi:hypothetical protein